MKNLVSATWLWKHIDDKDLVIIDCRFSVYDSEYGKKNFPLGHIKNSIFCDLDKEVVGIPEKHGGARPLPDLEKLKLNLSKLGVDNNSKVVIYDDLIHSSARLWWTLKYIGHNNCFILDGGLKGWTEQDYPLTDNVISAKKSRELETKLNDSIFCDIDYVKKKKDLKEVVLIDGRINDRFTGKIENLYKKAGHIPGAVNFDCRKNINNGYLLPKKRLSKLWDWLKPYSEIINYCGSGIAASVNFLVLDEIGYSSRLYIGGFSDWISNEYNPVDQGNEDY